MTPPLLAQLRCLRRKAPALAVVLLLVACSQDAAPSGPGGPRPNRPAGCDLNLELLAAGAVLDAIPSIDHPRFVSAEERVPTYLDSETRVIGLMIEGLAYAIPHNVLWFHEIVNLTVGGRDLAITYCPLTGSSVVFDRSPVGGSTFGVSGLLYQNNLILYDRSDPSSHWPQMVGEARCGPRLGTTLPQWPVVEMLWESWIDLHPETLVLSEDQGYALDDRQGSYPYGQYEELWFASFWIPELMPEADLRRPSKERVLGVPASRPGAFDGIAFPFDALTAMDGSFQVVNFSYDLTAAVVLWSDEARGGMAYRPRTETGLEVSLAATDSGFEDALTPSTWTVDGRAISGPLAGETLVSIERAYAAVWGAWAALHPETRLALVSPACTEICF